MVAAVEQVRRRGLDLRLLLAGDPDPANPVSIPAGEIEGWARRDGIEVLGHVDDIRKVWARAHIAVLPSRREGLPKSLLEAAACGRSMIATDTPGCREIAIQGKTALTFPVDDAAALAEAMTQMAGDAEMRARFGSAARALVEEKFSAEAIGKATVALYQSLVPVK